MNVKRIKLAMSLCVLTGIVAIANPETTKTEPSKQETMPTMYVAEAVKIDAPLIIDSVDMRGNAYKPSALLDTPIRIADDMAGYSIAATDTAGCVTLERPAEGTVMYVLRTTLRPERYAEGKLNVTSTAIADVRLDRKSKAKIEETADSMHHARPATVNMKMLPEVEYTVDIKVLVDADTLPAPMIKVVFTPDEDYKDVAVASATDLRHFETRDLRLGTRIGGVSISPDGKYLMLKYVQTRAKDKRRQWCTLTDLSTGKEISDHIPSDRAWMPKGSTLYYTVASTDGYDIVAVDVPSMRESVIATGVPESRFDFSPVGDYIVYSKREEADKPGAPLRRYADPDDRIPGNNDRHVPMLYHLRTGVAMPLTFGNRQTNLVDISPDGGKLLLGVRDYDATTWPFYFTDLYQLTLGTMAVDTLLRHDPDFSNAIYSPDASQLFIVASPDAFGGIGLNIGDHPIANAYDNQGYIYDIATGKARAMTRDFNPSISGSVKWCAADGNIYFRAENGFDNSVYSLDPRTGAFTQIPQDIAWIQQYSIGDDNARWLAYFGQSYDCSGRAYLYDTRKHETRLLADPWAPIADRIAWGDVDRWCFTASDGTEIEGFVTLPPDFDPAKKYPLIVYYYGGTSPTQHNTYSPYNAQLFASRGYVVYQLNPSGTTGYGQEFSARHVNAWGDRTADDIIEGVKEFCATHPYIDAGKVGCIGASYGGFMTEYLQTLTDIFAAAVSHAGISNVTSYWGEGYWGYSYNAQAAAKSYPWTDPELYTRHGALFNADKIHTPLLMTHGTADTNVPVGESIQLFNALKILGRDVELVTVDDEDHYISGTDNRDLWQNTVMAWFARYLQDAPQWWESIYGVPAK